MHPASAGLGTIGPMAPAHPRFSFLLLLFVVTLAAFVSACAEETDDTRQEGLWFAFPESVFGREGPIRMVHVDSGAESFVGDPGIYRHLAWAPGGDLLAAIRLGSEPHLTLFNLEDPAAETLFVPVASEEAHLAWSPDGARLAVISVAEVAIYTPELRLVNRVEPPEETIGPAAFSGGIWSPDSALFGSYYHGYLLIVDRLGKPHAYNPQTFVRYPGDTRWMTVTGWESPVALAVFEESDRPSPTRYVLNVRGANAEVLSSSDFEEGAGPFDRLLAQASEAAGGAEVILGRSAAPPELRWVVALPGPGDSPLRVLVRRGELFLSPATGLFTGAEPADLARDLSVLFFSDEDRR